MHKSVTAITTQKEDNGSADHFVGILLDNIAKELGGLWQMLDICAIQGTHVRIQSLVFHLMVHEYCGIVSHDNGANELSACGNQLLL